MEKLENGNRSEEECESHEEEELDPRIQGELEKLNQSTDDINRWETELEDCRQRFRAVLVEATVKLDEQVKRIGRAVEDSKPYWEARRVARQAQLEAQRATGEFQRAVEILRAAKETIALAEERLLEEDSRQFDSAWQEMLNHATNRVMEAETARTRSELEHRKTANHYNACISHMRQLENKLKRTINKSRPYFELKAKYYLQLEQLRRHVDKFQAKLTVTKADYRTTLRNLETISEEIHSRRHSITMGTRGRGVGAEGEGGNEDITNFKMESDGLSMASVTFDEGGNSGGSEEETKTHSTSAPLDMPSSHNPSSSSSSSLHPYPSTPLDLPCSYPSSSFSTPSAYLSPCPSLMSSSCPSAMEGPSPGGWLSPESRCGSPLLGPRSQCSGASSPDCDQERGDRAEGAEQKLEAGLSKLTLTITHPLHPGNDDPKDDPKTTSSSATTTHIPNLTILQTNSA
ncbi:SH3 domain-binding protein 5 isoform X1 [Salmo salar]|uniref:SH3 domain-binding protein 5 n=1 Tax=Salmo salar TaxID=8030 RepID=A0A1S3Q113_SALSA|nr:SH3 domain-binding protein 5 isoform X1 [Salmo salar]|eukprot:XP_014033566.1 PREDICTED: SH3 domain-binding protein 5-like isoform X1 [Salmo salar]